MLNFKPTKWFTKYVFSIMIEISSKISYFLNSFYIRLNSRILYLSKEVLCLKIAFWSNANEKCNVSANLAAISIASVIRYPYSIIAMENRLCHNNLGRAFFGITHIDDRNEVGTNYYDGGGIEGLLRKIYRGNYNSDILSSYLKEIINNHLYYIPQSRVIHSEIFDYELDHCIHELFRIMEETADICFIDTASHRNLSTKTILEEADLIVVNLCQKQIILEDFFLNYSSLISKAVFIISNYDSCVLPNSRRIAKNYDIPWDSILCIPYNEAFTNAFTYGSTVEFISRNYSCPKENPNYLFIQAVKKASFTIMKKAEQMVKLKEINLCCK
jgi:hypothetical protein